MMATPATPPTTPPAIAPVLALPEEGDDESRAGVELAATLDVNALVICAEVIDEVAKVLSLVRDREEEGINTLSVLEGIAASVVLAKTSESILVGTVVSEATLLSIVVGTATLLSTVGATLTSDAVVVGVT